MNVEIVNFPETKITVIEHHGSPSLEPYFIKKLIQWRKENQLPPSDLHRSYGIHYGDPEQKSSLNYHVDFCVSIVNYVTENIYGVVTKIIPAQRCAKLRHFGSRENVAAANILHQEWLPNSGEKLAKLPVFFHYINVGTQLQEADMITDVYLPIL